MRIRYFLLLTSVFVILSSCSNEMRESENDFAINMPSYESVYNGVNFKITPSTTKSNSDIYEYIMEASYDDISSKTIVNVTKIDDKTSYVEHLSVDGTLIASMKMVDNYIVSMDFNENVNDEVLGAIQTKSAYTDCVGRRYKEMKDVIDSDGKLMILCDLIPSNLCSIAILVSSAMKCLKE